MSKDLEKFSQFKSSDEKEKNKKMTNKPEWKEKRVSLGNAIIIGAVLAVFGAIVGINFPYWFPGVSQYCGVSGGSNNWSELDEVYNKLSGSYNGEIDKNVLIEGAKSGMVDALGDIYTVYMDKEESTSYVNTALHGNVGAGIGVEFGLRDGYMRVLRVLPDNPAIRAGVMIGDIIYKVNGEVVTASSTTELASVLRGDAGTEVTVTMIRDGEEKDFKMRREEINNVSVYDKYEVDLYLFIN